MKARNVFIAIVVALSLIIGYIPTFSFAVTEKDFDGNDSLDFKVDPPKSTTVYFDFDDEDEIIRVNGPTDYWIEFTVYDDGKYLSYTTHNVQIDELSVKGGNAYRLYSGLGSSGSGFRAPDNDGGNIPQISHYSFNVTLVTPPPPPDPLGEIDVTKIVKDEDDKVIPNDDTRFEFELYMWVDDGWDEVDEESPFYIDGNGTKTIDGLTLGKYKVVEVDIPEGYDLDAEVDFIEVTLTKMDLEKKAEFTNIMDDDTPPPPPDDKGSLIVHKRILRHTGSVDANLGDDEFTIRLSGPLPVDSDLYEVRVLTINDDANGDNVTFNDLPYGDYILEETHINGEAIGNHSYHIQLPGNNGEIVGSDVEIDSKATVNRWLVNHETPPPPPWDGTIRVRKLIRENPNASVAGFEFELWMDDEKVAGPLETDIYGEVDFPGLAAGTYEIREVNTDYLAEYLDDNPVTIGPEMGNENDDVWVIRVNNYTIDLDDIVVKKIVSNADEGDSLSGFVFRLYRIVEEGPDEFVGERTTGPSGIVVFEDQPDGDYVLYEVPRAGYFMGIGAPDSDDGYEFSHSIYMEYPIEVTNRKLPPPPDRGFITVEKIVQTRFGNVIQGNNTPFYFELHKRVEGSWVFEDEGSILGNGTLVFGPLDDGEYRVREVDIDDDFDLFTSNNLIVEIENGSDEDVSFINRRVPPPPPDDDDDDPPPDDDDDDPPPPPPTPTPTPTPEPEVVVIEPVPEAPPAVLEEVEVVEEPVPEAAPVAVLPKTGAADPFAISGLGGLLLGLGLFLKKKKEE